MNIHRKLLPVVELAGTTRKANALTIISAEGGWTEHHGDAYRCPIYLFASPTGFSAKAATLPGVAAQGPTAKDALEGVEKALAVAISDFKKTGRIPWSEMATESPEGSLTRWVIVRL